MWRITSGIFMGWSLGANDSANIFGTAVASGLIKYRIAIWLTATFVMLGATLEGAKCIKTLTNLSLIDLNGAFFISLATALTMTFLTYIAIPASTSQAIIGAIIGWTIIYKTPNLITLYKIVICWILTPLGGIFIGWMLYHLLSIWVKRYFKSLTARNKFYFYGVLLTGCYGAYSLGANNVANVTGIYVGAGLINASLGAIIGGISICLGVLTYSRRVMLTVGRGIVPLDSFSALTSVFAEAIVLHIFTQVGVPVSSSQAIVGSVIGIGIAKDIKTINKKIITKIFLGWVATPTIACLIAFMCRFLFNITVG